MSRYLAFVLLALSATSVLAAPAEIPALPSIPDLATVTDPVLGPRSNNKVYSPNTLHKRDWEYPSSTKDCRLSEVTDDSTTLSYTHDGVEYSEECLTRLALSVPFEDRKSCRATGPDARGYDEECLYKKAFDEDWKFDIEKAKKEELAWRAANPDMSASDAWRTHYPNSVADCTFTIGLEGTLKIVDGKEEKEGWKWDGEEKEAKGGKKKDTTDTSDGLKGWSPYSVTDTGDKLDNDCMIRLVIRLKLVIDIGSCPADHESVTKPKAHSISDVAAPVRDNALSSLFGRSSTVLAAREGLDIVVSALVALRLGCILNIVLKIILAFGIDAELLTGPLDTVVNLATGLLTTLLSGL